MSKFSEQQNIRMWWFIAATATLLAIVAFEMWMGTGPESVVAD